MSNPQASARVRIRYRMASRRPFVIASSIASFVLAICVLMLACDSAGPAEVRLRGHVPDAIKSATRVSADTVSPESEPVTLTIVLKRSNESAFQQYLRDVYDRRSQRFHRFLKSDEITAQFGPSASAYASVLSYLRNYGFRIVEGSANRMTITASGTRRQAQRAFGTRLSEYEASGRRFFANDVDPSVPASLAANIDAIVGLSNLPVPQPAQLAAALVNALAVLNWELRAVSVAAPELVGPTAAAIDATLASADAAFWEVQSLGVAEMLAGFEIVEAAVVRQSPARYGLQNTLPSRARSGINPATILGAGQKIGILAFSSINPQDVADWLALTKHPANLASQVTQVAVNGGAPLGPDETDVLMAIETILTVAPGAQVVIYHAPKATTSFQTLFNAMLNDGVTVISNSSTYCESQTTLADAQSIDNVLAVAAAAGINVFNATGDAGSSCSDGSANTIAVPADSPNAIAVGATSPTYGPDFTYGGEAWLDGSTRVPPTAQSGFGVSKFFNKPAYQTGLISGTARSVPDVVAPGDPQTGIAVCQADAGGCPTAQVFGGTSLATPFWAAVAALINQGTGHPIGFLNPLLYPLADTGAFNSAASMGTDAAHVGLGSPNGDALALALSGHTTGAPSGTVSRIKATSSDPFLPFVGTVPADGTSAAAIVVYLRDAKGNQVSGRTVRLTASSGNATITPATGVSSAANGAVIFRVTDTVVENVTFTAQDQSDGITLTQAAAVNFIGPAPTAGGISANPGTVVANGATASTITVTLQSASGGGVPGRFITLSQGNGHSMINGPNPSVTDAN
ncbi:MAG TPA: protease pro-enzyme activation domain-containing protein, partial [Casimicrobiaceae bacterium]|nr:protease pro-enzyme activation domain-containing protein [Casimicrobiaceae bacterium]